MPCWSDGLATEPAHTRPQAFNLAIHPFVRHFVRRFAVFLQPIDPPEIPASIAGRAECGRSGDSPSNAMKAFRSIFLASCVGFAAASLYPAIPAGAADGLPPAVKQQVDTAVETWSASGNVGKAGAEIADLCNQNPGVALDIVGYAGEAAARTQLPERCLVSSSTCQELEQLLALLFERAMQLSGLPVVVAALPTTAPGAAPLTPPVVTAPAPAPFPATQGAARGDGAGTNPPPGDLPAREVPTGGGIAAAARRAEEMPVVMFPSSSGVSLREVSCLRRVRRPAPAAASRRRRATPACNRRSDRKPEQNHHRQRSEAIQFWIAIPASRFRYVADGRGHQPHDAEKKGAVLIN